MSTPLAFGHAPAGLQHPSGCHPTILEDSQGSLNHSNTQVSSSQPPPTSHQHHRRPLLESIASFSGSQRKDMICVVVHLKRQSLFQPWGIAFSMFDNRVVLGNVKENGRQTIQWCHSIQCQDHLLDPRVVFSPMLMKTGNARNFYPQWLHLHAREMASPNLMHQQLWSGDLVLSIDGFDPGYFQSLATFTTYLRTVQQCTMVVLRHPEVATVAMAHWDSKNYGTYPPPPDTPFRAATAADALWQRILSLPSLPVTALDPSTMIRQITPERHPTDLSNELNGGLAFGGPRSLFGPLQATTTSPNPLDLLSRVAASSNASSRSFQAARDASTAFLNKSTGNKVKSHASKKLVSGTTEFSVPSSWRNPWFQDKDGNNLPYDDNWEFSPEDGTRDKLFLSKIDDFSSWLVERKQKWKRKYNVYKHASEKREPDASDVEEITVAHDFWSPQGFESFKEWMKTRVSQWKLSYAWNKRKRQRIQTACEAIVHVSQEPKEFHRWLRIRRNQWRLLRRKRQRLRYDLDTRDENTRDESQGGKSNVNAAEKAAQTEIDRRKALPRTRKTALAPSLNDIAAIDVILEQEDQERKRRQSEKKEPVDISFIFDASRGAPDDVVVHCLSFLDSTEYRKLLCISKTYASALKSREEVWRQLCPSHWVLPRRPRKSWHELYFHKLHEEKRNSQKLWDDLIVKCSGVLFKGDHLQKIEKLVLKGASDFGFNVNYVSPVVCERNSILNLAVIHQRHKVVRWLVDQKSADIESCDRGHFTALLNAAWAGDRQLVRFLMQRGANRSKIGYGHYSRALAHPDFKGLTAEGWARKRGHDEIAELIRLGL